MSVASDIASARLEVESFGFRIPCRRFSFAINITRDRRLPVVDEFALRILRLLESVSSQRLRAFFGFSPREFEIVISELVRRGHVGIDGDTIKLLPAADELFAVSTDAIPRIIAIEPSNETVWFDLVAKNMLPPDKGLSPRHLIEVKPDRVARQIPVEYARNAFMQNFSEYIRTVKASAFADQVNLYSVTNVEPRGYGWSVFKASEVLTISSDLKLETDYGQIASDRVPRLLPLLDAMSRAKNALSYPQVAAHDVVFMDEVLGRPDLSVWFDRTSPVDLQSWFQNGMAVASAAPDTRPIIGAIYLPTNVELLAAMVEKGNLDAPKSSDPTSGILWARSAGTIWGVTPDIQSALGRLKAARRIAGSSRTGNVAATLLDMHRTAPEAVRSFRGIFDRGVSMHARNVPRSLDCVIVGGIAASFTIRVEIGSDKSVPLGYITSNRQILNRLETACGLKTRVEKGTVLWEPQIAVAEAGGAKVSPAGSI